jgi:hypothetical protein
MEGTERHTVMERNPSFTSFPRRQGKPLFFPFHQTIPRFQLAHTARSVPLVRPNSALPWRGVLVTLPCLPGATRGTLPYRYSTQHTMLA